VSDSFVGLADVSRRKCADPQDRSTDPDGARRKRDSPRTERSDKNVRPEFTANKNVPLLQRPNVLNSRKQTKFRSAGGLAGLAYLLMEKVA
jgi:hypothetical protein